MADVHTPEGRSRNMRAIRGKNTRPEMKCRKLLFSRGFRYRLHVSALPGKPDLILPRHRVAIFVHGCFWHGHDCYLFKVPQTRKDFWEEKIAQNKARDLRDTRALHEGGWRVLTVWECALKGRLSWDPEILGDYLSSWILTKGSCSPESIRHVSAAAVQPVPDRSS